ncbi:uncharacterized protein LOC107633148 [Arachis ipaensis]|uniref:uncharacterized protein LOC107633148 n=1 Tax=Arachis ipaensis TaxID=130454 RepID=UPI0007AF86FF|nr:uncharacterized protein LOC107633148 [Arachis ipaensis]
MYTFERNLVNNGATQKRGVLEVGNLDAILAQNKLMSQQINMITKNLSETQRSEAYYLETAYELDVGDNTWTTMEEVGQPSKRIPEIPFNTLPSNAKVNPKEESKALTIEVVTQPKEKPAIKELKEIRAHEETDNVTLHTPVLREEPEEYSSPEEDEESKEEQIAWYLKILRKLKANSSHTEALEEEDEPVILAKECSALALCDLGSSINLMPLSVTKRLGILEVQRVEISLEMADKSLKKAYGMVENVLVKVEDFYIPNDFVILDNREDRDESIILERPFLATAKAIIDVEI